MPYSLQYRDFSADKQRFFTNVTTQEEAQTRAQQKPYPFLANNRGLIEQEFNQLFTTLKKNGEQQDAFWLYCYYCSVMLHAFYTGYDKPDQIEKYRLLSEQILFRCQNGQLPASIQNEDEFLSSLQKKISGNLADLASTPKHVSKTRDWIGFINITRIQLIFSRFTVRQSLVLARDSQWIDKLDSMTGRHTDVNAMIGSLDAQATIFNAFSVGIFVARLMLNAAMVIKHTFKPTAVEASLSYTERFSMEIKKRHCEFINDVVWGSVNGLTNYASLFNISAPVANWMIAGFLFFDASMMIYKRHLAETDYLLKKAQYTHEKQMWDKSPLKTCDNPNDRYKWLLHNDILTKQHEQLELSWQVTNATFCFNVAAGLMLVGSFSASLLLSSAVSSPICFFIGAIAMAMYLSGDAYGDYHEKHLLLQQAQCLEVNEPAAIVKLQSARNVFAESMIKNTVMPIMLMTTLAISWPATIMMVALFMGYETAKAYSCHPEKTTPSLQLS